MVSSASKVKAVAMACSQPSSESENDHHDCNDAIEGMDCRRDIYRRSMQSSSSLSHLQDSLIANPAENESGEKMLSLSDVDHDNDSEEALRHRRRLFAGEDQSNTDCSQYSADENDVVYDDDDDDEEGEEEGVDGQLSEYWDQVRCRKCLNIYSRVNEVI